jgi:hypothetical protein
MRKNASASVWIRVFESAFTLAQKRTPIKQKQNSSLCFKRCSQQLIRGCVYTQGLSEHTQRTINVLCNVQRAAMVYRLIDALRCSWHLRHILIIEILRYYAKNIPEHRCFAYKASMLFVEHRRASMLSEVRWQRACDYTSNIASIWLNMYGL